MADIIHIAIQHGRQFDLVFRIALEGGGIGIERQMWIINTGREEERFVLLFLHAGFHPFAHIDINHFLIVHPPVESGIGKSGFVLLSIAVVVPISSRPANGEHLEELLKRRTAFRFGSGMAMVVYLSSTQRLIAALIGEIFGQGKSIRNYRTPGIPVVINP